MAHEVETKVLGIDEAAVRARLAELGARQIADGRLRVWWYGVPGLGDEGQPWRLRIRTGHGKNEVNWKGKAVAIPGATTRTVEEIETTVSDPDALAELFVKIGLEMGAYQEKDRTSWELVDPASAPGSGEAKWHFDLDQYPGIPAFIEIEGKSEAHIEEAIKLLGLEGKQTWTTGERRLVEQVYHTNWHNMKFDDTK